MAQELFSAEEVANLLGLNDRTVRNYIRAGRLRAVRIGKQYRIAREDLEAFMGHPISTVDRVRRERHVEVSSVVQIDAISVDSANRVSNTLMAAAKGGREGDQALRIDSIYDEERGRLKVIINGSVDTSIGLLKLIDKLAEPKS